MLTVDNIIEHIERLIAEDRLSGNRAGLMNTQRGAGFLMAVADASGDKQMAARFRSLAAQAANKNEELEERR